MGSVISVSPGIARVVLAETMPQSNMTAMARSYGQLDIADLQTGTMLLTHWSRIAPGMST